MGFRNGAYATIWEVKEGKGNYADVRISISKKNKQTNEYENDFNGFVRFIGDAGKKVQSYKEKDRVKLGDCDVTNHYDKEKKVTYTNCVVFSFEDPESNGASNNTSNGSDGFMNIPDDVNDSGLPFN